MRQPNWKRWEVILLVDMYFRVNEHNMDVKEECLKLSTYLRESNRNAALSDASYRNYQGLLMKYQNINSIVNGKGLGNHSKLDVEIVEYHNENLEEFKKELESIKKCIPYIVE